MTKSDSTVLKEVVLRLRKIEKAVFSPGGKHKVSTADEKNTAGSLPRQILRLRDEGFFNQPKTAGETHVRLRPKYPCEFDRVAMALLRLQKRAKFAKLPRKLAENVMSHMAGKVLKERAKALPLVQGSRYQLLQKLILEGFFDAPVSSAALVLKVKERFGKSWKTIVVQTYMQKFMQAEIIRAVKLTRHKGNYWVLASVSREDALKSIGKKKKVLEIEEELFSDKLQKKLRKNFRQELEELRTNFGINGNCTAFLLRKTLEKLIIIVMSKNAREKLLEDKARPGGWVGLKDMIETAAREKLNGVPFLIPKTANEIKGIKFLGDTAAHNPLSIFLKVATPTSA